MECVIVRALGYEWAFPASDRSDAKNEKDRIEEDTTFAGPDTVERMRLHIERGGETYAKMLDMLHIDNWQGWVMFCCANVAKHYGVDRREVEKYWMERYGISLFQKLEI